MQSVVEGLHLAPVNTGLKLIPLYRKKEAVNVVETVRRSALDPTKLMAGLQKQDAKRKKKKKKKDKDDNDGEEGEGNDDDDDDDDDDEIKTKLIGYKNTSMTRCEMLQGVIMTTFLCILLYLVAYAKTDISLQREYCEAIVDTLNAPFENVITGKMTDMLHIHSMSIYQDFLVNAFPYALFPNCLTGPLALVLCANATAQPYIKPAPIVLREKNILLGGIRISQTRGTTSDDAICRPTFFSSSDSYFPYTTGTNTLPSEVVIPTDDPFRYTTVDLDSASPEAVGEYVSAQLRDNSRGTIDQCYEQGTSREPYGPMAAGASAEARARIAAVHVGSVECDPACTPNASYSGLESAFVYQTAAELGDPFAMVASFAGIQGGGYSVMLPANLTFYELRTVLSELVQAGWMDRQTLNVGIDLPFYNPQIDHLAHMQIVMKMSRAGHASVQLSCVAGTLQKISGVNSAFEIILSLWLTLRLLIIFLQKFVLNRKAKVDTSGSGGGAGGGAGGAELSTVACTFTPELIVHLLTTTLGLGGSAMRIVETRQTDRLLEHFELGAPWPPPYLSTLPTTLLNMRYSSQLFGAALLVTVLRYVLYYSIISKRLFLMRVTMGAACFKLVPALIFLILAMAFFSVGGNLLYGTSQSWKTFVDAFGTTVYLLRRPMAMPFWEMGHSAVIWPTLATQIPSLVDLLFLSMFTGIVLWILTNLYRAVIINEYSSTLVKYHDREPGDLKPDPWPSFNPAVYLHAFSTLLADKSRGLRINGANKREWSRGLKRQMELAKKVRTEQDRKFREGGFSTAADEPADDGAPAAAPPAADKADKAAAGKKDGKARSLLPSRPRMALRRAEEGGKAKAAKPAAKADKV